MRKLIALISFTFLAAITTFAQLAAPTLSSPSDGYVYDGNIKPLVRWNSVTGANQYTVQWDTTPTFDSPALDDYSFSSSYTSLNINGLKFNTTYYWRVRATDSNNDTGEWSEAWSFTTCSGPVPSSPSNGYVYETTIKPNVSFSSISNAAHYIVQWDTVPTFNSPALDDYSFSSSYTSLNINGLKFNTTYYWRVRATNTNDSDTSAWSSAWSFTTCGGPTLSSPSNGNVYSSTIQPTVSWNSISGAAHYILAWDTVPTFDSPIASTHTRTSTSVGISALRFNTTYYWRVCATNTNDSDTSAWSSAWSFTTMSAPTLSSPSNGSTGQAIRPSLYCNSISNAAHYIFEWDTVPTFNSEAYGTSYSTNRYVYTTQLAMGTTYYWHAKITNSNDSDTSQWSPTWSFTTTGARPTLYSPSNNSTGKYLQLTISWNSISSVNSYDYECDTTPNFNSAEKISGNTTSTSANINVYYYNTNYYWRVRTHVGDGISDWSDVWKFTTARTINLEAPSNNSTLITLLPNLDWDYINGGQKYQYQCDTSLLFNSPLLVSGETPIGTSEVNLSDTLFFGETYNWHVRQISARDTSDWSNIWKFNIPNSVSLTSPSNGATGRSTSLTLDWEYINGGRRYEYQYDTCATFNSPSFVSGTTIIGTSEVAISGLRLGTTYYWRVREISAVDTTDWSTVWHFTTTGGTPSLVTPNNNSTNQSIMPTLDWSPVSSCSYYDYECDVTPDFNSAEKQSGSIAVGTSEVDLDILRFNTTYYWRVRTRAGIDTSSWSAVWHFTTKGSIALTSPENNSTLYRTIKPTLDWDYIQYGTYYEYQYGLDQTFANASTVTGRIAVGTSEIDINESLLFGETYYWRVREFSAVDTTPWSNVWNFTTPNILPLTSPANGTTGVGESVTLDWDYINGGQTYEYQYDITPNFNSENLSVGTVEVETSRVDISNLAENSTYYWRVREISSVDTTEWSAVWHFATRTAPMFTEFNDTACDSYTWNNHTYEVSGDYTQQFTATNSADSTVTLHLVINHSSVRNISASSCETYTWNDSTYTTSGDYTWEGQTVNGCDSIVNLHLTISHPETNEIYESACNSYTWHNATYTTSGEYTWEGQTAGGCDSVVTLHLTINHSTSYEFADIACTAYTWNGTTYTTSGDYTQTLTNANNCDSVVTLHLAINQPVTANESITICESELPYTWNDVVFTEAGSQSITLTATNGCDSTLTMTVYVTEINTDIELLEPDCVGCNSILAVFQENAEYQWINCDNNAPIENATNSEFAPTETGNYACVLNIGGCTDTTECVQVIWTDILEDFASSISIYPNPTPSICNVECDIENAEIQLYDVTGKCVFTQKANGNLTSINISNLAPGTYILQIVADGKNVGMAKVIKEK